MNHDDLRSLASRAEQVRGRPDTRLAEVRDRIRSTRRRRVTEAVAGTSAAVVALVVGVALLAGPTGQKKDDGPVPPVTTETPKAARKIVYSDNVASIPHRGDTPLGRVRTIHVGDREVRIDQVLRTVQGWALKVTDAGVVYAKDDHTVWFTDGGEPRQIAEQACVDTTQYGGLATGNAGPWAVWFDCSAASRGADLVVFDTAAGREVARHPVPACRGREAAWPAYKCGPRDVVGEHVYISVIDEATDNATRDLVLDVSSDQLSPVGPELYARDVDAHPRGLVIGDDPQKGVRTTGPGQVFRVVGPQLVPVRNSDLSEFVGTTAFRTGTGDAVRLRLPDGYRARRSDPTDDPPFFFLAQWLDDGTVAMVRGNTSTHLGDLLVCRLADGRCEVAVPAPRGDATRIMPGVHLPG